MIFLKDPDAIILRIKTTTQSRVRPQERIQKASYDMHIFKKDFILNEKFQYKQRKKYRYARKMTQQSAIYEKFFNCR